MTLDVNKINRDVHLIFYFKIISLIECVIIVVDLLAIVVFCILNIANMACWC